MQNLDLIEKFQETKILQIVRLRERLSIPCRRDEGVPSRPVKMTHQTFLGKNSLQHTWKVLQCKQMIQKGTTKMLNRTFAAVYFYFYFTFFRGKVNFAAMS